MRLLKKGAEASLYSVNIFGKKFLAKCRLPKRYRIDEIDEVIRKARTKKEARILYALDAAGLAAPKIVGLGKFTIYMTKLDGKLLMNTPLTPGLFNQIGKLLAKMHSIGIVHGDFTPANIIVDKGRVAIIDFGLSETTQSIEEKALDLLLLKRSVEKRHYKVFEDAYITAEAQAKQILKRLSEIEERGRYQTRSLG